jgi:hypothetical protein
MGRLPLSTLFTHPSIEGLASLMREQMCYAQLARHLGTEQPLYGLEARGLEGIGQPFTTLKAMAEACLRAVRQVQPEGPYLLAYRSLSSGRRRATRRYRPTPRGAGRPSPHSPSTSTGCRATITRCSRSRASSTSSANSNPSSRSSSPHSGKRK